MPESERADDGEQDRTNARIDALEQELAEEREQRRALEQRVAQTRDEQSHLSSRVDALALRLDEQDADGEVDE